MTSISPVAASTAPAPVTSNTSIAAIAEPKPVAQAAPSNGPAATIELSEKALAMINGDRDWKPGMKIDSY
jgi:hypothetical protein